MTHRHLHPTLSVNLRRLRARRPAIAQAAVAALAAWWIARAVVPDPRPSFAAIAALITLGATHGEQRQRAVQLAGGVALGLTLSSLIIDLIGTGAPQIALMVVLAMSVAVLVGGGEVLVSEAAVSAILLLSLSPASGPGFEPNRIFEALIGGAVALAVGALLFPPDPVLHVGRAAQAVLGELGRTLERLAGALASHDAAAAEQALLEARAIDPRIDELDAALAVGRETARTAPPRFAARAQIERYDRSLGQLDLAVRNTRVLARHALRALRGGAEAPAELPLAVAELAQAVWALAAAYEEPQRAAAAFELAAGAAARASALTDLPELAVQVSSTAVDLMRAAEQVQGAPDRHPTEELLAVRPAA
jgi:uncharacterized membrane protein YgaE (UPF0421/DUF939 family)